MVSEDQLGTLAGRVHVIIGPEVQETLEKGGHDTSSFLGFPQLGERLRAAREARGLDFKSAARDLRCPQYRLRDVERASLCSLDPALLETYATFLGEEETLASWQRAYPWIAATLLPKRD